MPGKRDRQGQAGEVRGLQSIQSPTWAPGLRSPLGCCGSQDLHCKASARALHTTATSLSAGPAGPRPTGLGQRSPGRDTGSPSEWTDPCEYGKAAGPPVQDAPFPPAPQESFRCEGVSGVDTEEVSKNQRWTRRAVCLPTTQSLGPDHHRPHDTLCSRFFLKVRVPGTVSNPRTGISGSPGITDTSTWKVGHVSGT